MGASLLRRRRIECGLTQGELAARAGVSRQLVAAVEAGRNVPAVDAAVRLAHVLGSSVEELFAAPAPDVVPALGQPLADDVPLRVGRVGESLVTAYLADHGVAGTGWADPDGVLVDGTLRMFPGAAPAGAVVAGCDPAFGLAERMLHGLGPRSLLAISAPTGAAVRALSEGRVHAAVVHAMTHELPALPLPVARWHVARWQVGLAVDSKFRARSLEEALTEKLPIVGRDPEAMSQRAFERASQAWGFPSPPQSLLAAGHLDAARLAAAIGGAGVTTEGAAWAFGLDFLALETHVVQLWVDQRWAAHPGLVALADLLGSSAFTERLAQFGGYDLAGCGARVEDVAGER